MGAQEHLPKKSMVICGEAWNELQLAPRNRCCQCTRSVAIQRQSHEDDESFHCQGVGKISFFFFPKVTGYWWKGKQGISFLALPGTLKTSTFKLVLIPNHYMTIGCLTISIHLKLVCLCLRLGTTYIYIYTTCSKIFHQSSPPLEYLWPRVSTPGIFDETKFLLGSGGRFLITV